MPIGNGQPRTYSIAADTATGAFNSSALKAEIEADVGITTVLLRIDRTGDVLDIWFVADLSAPEITALDAVVLAHLGVAPLPAADSINIEDEDVAVPNTPHSTINFTGTGVTAVDAGAGQVDVTIPGSSTFQGLGLWRYRTEITSTPTAGRLNFDNVNIDIATEMYVNVINDGGTDITPFLTLLGTDDLVYIQAQDDSTQSVVVKIGATPTLLSGVYTFPIGDVEAQGPALTNNETVAVLGVHSGDSSSLEVQDEGASLDLAVTLLNFLGAGVTAVENADHEIDITIPGEAPTRSFDAYDNTGGVTSIGVAATVGLDTVRNDSGAGAFTFAGNELTVNVGGTYAVAFTVSLDSSVGGNRSVGRIWLELNSVEVDGSRGFTYNRNTTEGDNTASGFVILTLTAADVLRLRFTRDSGASTLITIADASRLTVFTLAGSAGDVSVFGTEINSAESLGQSTTTSSTLQQKLRLTTTSLPAGDYVLHWSATAGTLSDEQGFRMSVELDDTTELADFTSLSGDDSSDGRDAGMFAGTARLTLNGVHNIDIDFAASGGTAFIRDARLTLWRIT